MLYNNLLKNFKGLSKYSEKCTFFRQDLIQLFDTCKTQILKTIQKPLPRPLKISLISIAGLFFVFIVSVSLIDPNQHKDRLEKWVFQKTGKVLILKGPLRLHVFPTFFLEAEKVILKENPNKKSSLIKIDFLQINPSFWSLMPGKSVLHVVLKDAKIKSFHIPQLKTKITYKKNIYEFTNIQLDIEKRKELKMLSINKFIVDTNQDLLKYKLTHEDVFHLEPLFVMSGLPTPLKGDMTVKIDLNAEGNTLAAMKKNLNGKLEIEISNGKFHGIDLITTLQDAKSLIKTFMSGFQKPFIVVMRAFGRKETPWFSERTPFKTMKVHAIITNGIVHNHNFDIHHHQYGIKGKGKINLVQETLDYQFHVSYKQNKNLISSKKVRKNKSTPLLIEIYGPFRNPSIKPNLSSYLEFIK